MADMLKGFVKKAMNEEFRTNYPHLLFPSCIYAKVVSVKTERGKYICTLKILDKNKVVDTRFPEIPFVKTEISLEHGDIAVVLLLYGEMNPYIIGRCEECR